MLIVLFATFVVCMLIFVLSFLYNFQIMFADIYIFSPGNGIDNVTTRLCT
jgi:hypothetical protein